jgi:hypothetical protein
LPEIQRCLFLSRIFIVGQLFDVHVPGLVCGNRRALGSGWLALMGNGRAVCRRKRESPRTAANAAEFRAQARPQTVQRHGRLPTSVGLGMARAPSDVENPQRRSIAMSWVVDGEGNESGWRGAGRTPLVSVGRAVWLSPASLHCICKTKNVPQATRFTSLQRCSPPIATE